MQRLSISLQTLKNVIESDCVYVDKTMYAHQVLDKPGSYFLARPRRFGKSLFLSTLHELAVGNRALFSGLWVDDKWDWTRKYEVMHLDFSEIQFKEEGLDAVLKKEILSYYKHYNLEPEADNLAGLFKNLIQQVSKINKIVLLID